MLAVDGMRRQPNLQGFLIPGQILPPRASQAEKDAEQRIPLFPRFNHRPKGQIERAAAPKSTLNRLPSCGPSTIPVPSSRTFAMSVPE